jgi:hypothetical protein
MSLPKRETEISSTYDVVFWSGRGGRALGGLIFALWRLDSGNPDGGRIEGGGISKIAAAIIANKIGEDWEPWGRTSEFRDPLFYH